MANAGTAEYTLTATDQTAAAFKSMNDRMKQVAENTKSFEKVASTAFKLFIGGELLEGFRKLGREMFNIKNAADKIDAQRLQALHDSADKAGAAFKNAAAIIGSKLAPILSSVFDWFTQLIGNGEDFKVKVGAVFAGLTRAVGVFADGFRGLQVIWEVLKIAFDGFILAIVTGLQTMDQAVVDVGNKLPGVHMQYSQTLAGMAASARKNVDETKADLSDLMSRPLPSKMMMDAVAQFDKMKGVAVRAGDDIKKALKPDPNDKLLDDVLDEASKNIGKHNDELMAGINKMRTAGQSELDALAAKYQAEQQMLEDAHTNEMVSDEEYQQLRLKNTKMYEDQVAAIKTAARKKDLGEFQWMEDAKNAFQQHTFQGNLIGAGILFGQLSTLMQSNRKKEFNIGKQAALANAFIHMYEGISRAWSYGPILGPTYAALVAANGMMAIRNIRSQQFHGGGAANVGAVASMDVGATGQPTSASPVVPEAPVLPQSSSSSAPARNVTVQVKGDGMVSMDWIRQSLVPALNEASGDGVKIMVA